MNQHRKANSAGASVVAVISVVAAIGTLYLPLFLSLGIRGRLPGCERRESMLSQRHTRENGLSKSGETTCSRSGAWQ